MLQTNPRFMAKLLEQLGGCAAIKAEFLGASQDAQYKEDIGPLISLWRAIQVVLKSLLVLINPAKAHFCRCLKPCLHVSGWIISSYVL